MNDKLRTGHCGKGALESIRDSLGYTMMCSPEPVSLYLWSLPWTRPGQWM